MPPKQRFRQSRDGEYVWFPKTELYKLMAEWQQMKELMIAAQNLVEQTGALEKEDLAEAFLRVNEELLKVQERCEKLEEDISGLRSRLSKKKLKQDEEQMLKGGKLL